MDLWNQIKARQECGLSQICGKTSGNMKNNIAAATLKWPYMFTRRTKYDYDILSPPGGAFRGMFWQGCRAFKTLTRLLSRLKIFSHLFNTYPRLASVRVLLRRTYFYTFRARSCVSVFFFYLKSTFPKRKEKNFSSVWTFLEKPSPHFQYSEQNIPKHLKVKRRDWDRY